MTPTEHAIQRIKENLDSCLALRNPDEILGLYRNDCLFLIRVAEDREDQTLILEDQIASLEGIIDDMKKDAGLVPQDATSIDVLRREHKHMKQTLRDIANLFAEQPHLYRLMARGCLTEISE